MWRQIPPTGALAAGAPQGANPVTPVTSEPPFVDTGYDETARVYDLEYPDCTGAELEFLASFAVHKRARVLELATGTGRVAFALARLGHEVTGLDISEGMLARARARRGDLDAGLVSRVSFTRADMAEFRLETQFDLVVAAFNALLLLPNENARAGCLRSSLEHLSPGGAFVADLFAANALDRTPDHETVEFLETEPQSGRRVTRERFYSYDADSDRGHSRLIYRLYDAGGQVAEKLQLGYSLALLSRDDVVREVRAAGFVDITTYGNHQREPWTPNSPNLLVCARRPDR